MQKNRTTHSTTAKLAVAGLLTAAAVAGSLLSVPVAGSILAYIVLRVLEKSHVLEQMREN